jgi:hypothetical protein
MGDQVATVPTTIEKIMRDPAFALGVADARAGLPFRNAYGHDGWDTNTQWHYERGRAWALLAPRDVRVRRADGKLGADAIRWFRHMEEFIL